jgi:hypothetical protein
LLKTPVLCKEKHDDNTEKIIINFKPELATIIKETKYLDRIGFKLPEIALNIALQVC